MSLRNKMKTDMDSPDAPWNGKVWNKIESQILEWTAKTNVQEQVDEDSFNRGMISAMNALIAALKVDWHIKALERKAEEL